MTSWTLACNTDPNGDLNYHMTTNSFNVTLFVVTRASIWIGYCKCLPHDLIAHIHHRLVSLALAQVHACLCASEVTLKDIGKPTVTKTNKKRKIFILFLESVCTIKCIWMYMISILKRVVIRLVFFFSIYIYLLVHFFTCLFIHGGGYWCNNMCILL